MKFRNHFYTYNPGQNIDDTFPNVIIFLAHCYYIEQTSLIPPPINVVLLFSLFISYRFNIVLGARGEIEGPILMFFH